MHFLKFRAWDKDVKKFINAPFKNQDRGILYGIGKEQDCELEQFIGLTDRNKVDIYEGDICGYFGDPARFEVVFEECAFRKKYPEWDETIERPLIKQWDIDQIGMRVIGNIHENPDLLK